MTTKNKILGRIMLALAVPAYGSVIALMAFYVHATIILGYAPRYNMPDPKELAIYPFYSPIVGLMESLWILSFLISLLLLPVQLFLTRHDKLSSFPFLEISAWGHIIALLLFFSGISEWYAD
jgi:hypothetical protein